MIRHALHEIEAHGQVVKIVERIDSASHCAAGRCWYRTARAPVAVVVEAHAQIIAFDMEGNLLGQAELGALMSSITSRA